MVSPSSTQGPYGWMIHHSRLVPREVAAGTFNGAKGGAETLFGEARETGFLGYDAVRREGSEPFVCPAAPTPSPNLLARPPRS